MPVNPAHCTAVTNGQQYILSPIVRELTKGDTVRQECRRPSDEHGHNTNDQPLVADLSAVLCKLHAPVQSAKEGKDDRPVRDLNGFDRVQRGHGRAEVETGHVGQFCSSMLSLETLTVSTGRSEHSRDAASDASRASTTVETDVPR